MAGVEFLRFMLKDLRPMLGAAGIEAKAKKMQTTTERRKTLSREVHRRETLRQVSIRRRKQNVSLKIVEKMIQLTLTTVFRNTSVSSTYPCLSKAGWQVRHTFECQSVGKSVTKEVATITKEVVNITKEINTNLQGEGKKIKYFEVCV